MSSSTPLRRRLGTALSALSIMAAMNAASAQQVALQGARGDSARFRLITLDPGHFHAGLVQKFMYPDVDSVVHVYSAGGDDLAQHLARIKSFNTRSDQPTHWVEKVYTGPDYLERMIADRAGNVVVISGNNARKTEYIVRSIDAGLNVLADKPMVRTPNDLVRLRQAFETAARKHVLLYDIMTERHEVTTALQRELSMSPDLFGTLVKGTADEPAISKVSVHHFSKIVSGAPLKRPEWFFDVRQQGEGIVDVTTHLVDLVQWEAFPGQTLKSSDVQMLNARRWTTAITPAQFEKVTSAKQFPGYLARDVKDGVLQVYSNGEMNYTLKGVHARVSVTWNFEAPEGTGDTHYSVMRGTRANLVIRQGAEQKYKPVLYVETVNKSETSFETTLMNGLKLIQSKYPGVELVKTASGWEVTIPEKYKEGHEAHFARVTEKFLQYFKDKKLPVWEVPNMIAKYYTTTSALELATKNGNK